MSFVSRLQQLAPVQLAKLKQNLNASPWTNPETMTILAPLIPKNQSPEPYALVAFLYAWHRGGDSLAHPTFGHSARRLCTLEPQMWESVYNRRFEALLNCSFDQLPGELFYWIRALHDHHVPVFWSGLLADLKLWYREEQQSVCQQWAQAVWGSPESEQPLVTVDPTDPTKLQLHCERFLASTVIDAALCDQIAAKLRNYITERFLDQPVTPETLVQMNRELAGYLRLLTEELMR